MIVDDDLAVCRSLDGYLSDRGFSVHAFVRAAEALDHLAARIAPVHVMIVDLVMPGKSGTDFIRAAKRAGFNGVSYLAFSGAAVDETEIRALKDMGCLFIEKPVFDLDSFVDVLTTLYVRRFFHA